MRLRCVSENRFGGFFRACHRVFATRDLSNDDGAVDKEKQLLRKQFRVFETGSTSKALKVVRYEGLVVGSHAMNFAVVGFSPQMNSKSAIGSISHAKYARLRTQSCSNAQRAPHRL